MVVTVTHGGYVKRTRADRVPRAEARRARRQGRRRRRRKTSSPSCSSRSTHDHLLMFTRPGRVYVSASSSCPRGKRASRGKALVNFLELQEGEKVVTMLPLKQFDDRAVRVMVDARGMVKKTALDAFANIRSTGIIALSHRRGRRAGRGQLTNGEHGRALGHAQRLRHPLPEEQGPRRWAATRAASRASRCARATTSSAWRPSRGDAPATLLTVCEHGYGKRTPVADYPVKNRGGMGVITIKTSERNGKVVGCARGHRRRRPHAHHRPAASSIRIPVEGIPTLGRNTQGVRLMRVDEGEKVVVGGAPGRARGATAERGAGARPGRGARGRRGPLGATTTDDDDEVETPTEDGRRRRRRRRMRPRSTVPRSARAVRRARRSASPAA